MMASCSQDSSLYAYDILLVKYIPDLRLAGTITGVTVKLCNGTNAGYLRELLLLSCYISLAEKHSCFQNSSWQMLGERNLERIRENLERI